MTGPAPLALYGHPFSCYTWKAQIALKASGAAYELRTIDDDHPEHAAFIHARAGPFGTFPVLSHGDTVIFEATAIVEYLAVHFAAPQPLIPSDPDAAVRTRMLDRVFDNTVMNPMQAVVAEHIRDIRYPDLSRCAEARDRLHRSYAWLEAWLPGYASPPPGGITLVECAAAPALFYADWVERIDGERYPRLQAWRAHLLALPPVNKCVEAARPFRPYFPLGAPDRD